MKVRIGDITRVLEKFRLETSLFGKGAGRILLNNQNIAGFKPNMRTGNFWRSEISEQGQAELIGDTIIKILAAEIYAKKQTLDVPNRFVNDWTVCAFDCLASPACIAMVDSFEKGEFLKPKIRRIMDNRQLAFRNMRSLPRKTILEMAAVLLAFDSWSKPIRKGESFLKDCGVVFQHGFVLDADPARITVREFWNSTMDAEGMAKVVATMTEEEFTGREKVFSFANA